MAYLKGLIPQGKGNVFMDYLGTQGYVFRHSTVRYEIGQVLIKGRWAALTIDSKDVIGIPAELAELAQEFLKGVFNSGITDTQRLEFMFGGPTRHVAKEITGYNSQGQTHYEVYVEEGFMGAHKYPAIRFTEESRIRWNRGEGLDLQRQAIDLAINNPKPEGSCCRPAP